MKKIFLLLFLIVLFQSCKLPGFNNDKGSLVVSNFCENPNVEISAVYVKERDMSGYVLVYTGSIKTGQSFFIELKPGNYSVQIAATSGLFHTTRYYETGYNIYKALDENGFVNVIFDGKGIYFD